MKILLCIFLCSLLLNATNIQNIDIISSDKDIEISIFLDTKFKNKVIKQDSDGFSTIILKDVSYNENKISKRTELIKQIEIFQQNKDVYIILATNNFSLDYSLEVLSSNNILKILIKPQTGISSYLLSQKGSSLENAINSIKNQTNIDSIQNLDSATPVKLDSWRYAAVVSILVVLLIALVVAKRKMQSNGKNLEFSYFKKPKNKLDISVSRIINIDLKNKIIVLDTKDSQYLLFIGQNSSFIIDRLENKNNNDFSKLLEQKETKLSYFLKDYENETKSNF